MLICIGSTDGRIGCRATFGVGQSAEHTAEPIGDDVFDQVEHAFESDARARQLGSALFVWLFGPQDERRPLHEGVGERIYLFFELGSGPSRALVARIAALPWELLNDEVGQYPARDVERGIFRVASPSGAPLSSADDQLGSVWPLRIVAASGFEDNTTEFGMAEIKEQISALRQVFVPWGRSVDLEIIESTTNSLLDSAVARDCPTVLHFCGHARHLAGVPPSLVTITPAGQSDNFSIDQIADLGKPPIRLVVLSACRSAAAAGVTTEAIWQQSLAKMFLANGSKAVIAMQADIQAKAATEIVTHFYDECLKGTSVERALSAARRAKGASDPAWAIPSLTFAYMPPATGYMLFDAGRAVKTIIPFGSSDGHSPRFTANFHHQRREMFKWAARQDQTGQFPAPVVLLTGDANSGKTHFMQWALSNVVHLGQCIRYVDFTSFAEGRQSLVHLLRAVRDGTHIRDSNGEIDCDPMLKEPFEHFDSFNAELNAVLAGKPPPASPVIAAVRDELLPATESSLALVGDRPMNDFIAERFHASLRDSAARASVFIAMDIRPKTFEPTEFEPFLKSVVIPELARWHAAPTTEPTIRFAFCCRSESSSALLEPLNRWFKEKLGSNARPTEISFRSAPTADDLFRYFHEMYWFKGGWEMTDASNLILKTAKNPLEMSLCCKLTDLMKYLGVWHEVERQVGEMQ